MRSITDPPPHSAAARFDPAFGQRFLLTVETEGEFDWDKPFERSERGLSHVPRLAKFQMFCENEGVAPVYLVDWAVARSTKAGEILRGPLAAGKAEIGVLMHPWIIPPLDQDPSRHDGYAGNLPPELESAKFRGLRDAIEKNFQAAPPIYRAARYGAGPNTAGILAEGGIAIDTSVCAKFDYGAAGGPDYRRHPLAPYWLDDEHTLLELPLTTVFWGMLRRQGDWLYPATEHAEPARSARQAEPARTHSADARGRWRGRGDLRHRHRARRRIAAPGVLVPQPLAAARAYPVGAQRGRSRRLLRLVAAHLCLPGAARRRAHVGGGDHARGAAAGGLSEHRLPSPSGIATSRLAQAARRLVFGACSSAVRAGRS